MNETLLDSKVKDQLINMINTNLMEATSTRMGESLYTVKDKAGKILATIDVDSDYGAVEIKMGGKQVAFITYNENRPNPAHKDIFDVTHAAYERNVAMVNLKAKAEQFKKAAAELGITGLDLTQFLGTGKTM